jgi:hypothetical protein
MTAAYGSYVVLRAVSHTHFGESTNLGVGLYGGDEENLLGSKVGTLDRALARGDITQVAFENFPPADLAVYFTRRHPTLQSIRHAHESMGHAMSWIQVGEICGTIIQEGTVDRLYDYFVSGRGVG